MRQIILFLMALTLVLTGEAQDVYSLSFNTIDGKPVHLSDYRGKKLLFITVPLSAADTSVLASELRALQTKYASSLVIIGVPMADQGFKASDATKVKDLYKDQKAGFILAEGMRVKKTSGAEQSSLYQWLTDVNRNKHFSVDIKSSGYKIFLDESGRQYAVMPPQLRLGNPVIEKILAYKITPPKNTTVPANTSTSTN